MIKLCSYCELVLLQEGLFPTNPLFEATAGVENGDSLSLLAEAAVLQSQEATEPMDWMGDTSQEPAHLHQVSSSTCLHQIFWYMRFNTALSVEMTGAWQCCLELAKLGPLDLISSWMPPCLHCS